ncbi:Putative lipase atg15 [Rhodotorula toruloides]
MRLQSPSALLLSLSAACALQIPFSARTPLDDARPTFPPSSGSAGVSAGQGLKSLTLRHAIHLSTTERHLPPSQRDYSSGELDVLADLTTYSNTQQVKTRRIRTQRPSSQAAFQAARRASYFTPQRATGLGRLPTLQELGDAALGSTLEWDEVVIEVPDTRDVETLAAFGKMTSNAYTTPDAGNWYDIGSGWNRSDSFGWKEDGIRGHVFADETNSTVVIAIKGTSAFIVGGDSGTSKNDKINDNLFFSCCCARVDWSWSTVCDCYDGNRQCRQDCIEEAVMTKSAYYPVATDLYNNVSAIYPHAQIWLAGHSLGGALAAMLSRTYGVPSISFESPGDLLPSRRLHLPLPPPPRNRSRDHLANHDDKRPKRSLDDELTTHVYHSADPIPNGVCTGAFSTCGLVGFALESRCHTGKTIMYDTVGRLGWSVDIRTHSIHVIVDKLLVDDWGVKPSEVDGSAKGSLQAAGLRRKRGGWFGWWPGRGRKDEDDKDGGKEEEPEPEDGQHGGRGVPEPHFEDETCSDCEKWTYV